jgi:D-sedoheptulose 7-phosphate isomerase
MQPKKAVQSQLADSARIKTSLAATQADAVVRLADILIQSLESGGKILFCGNGGSAADSQHLAAELLGRYKRNRRALSAAALTTDTSVLTAVGNDYGFETVFSRQVEAFGRKGDVLIGISTSGRSPNVVRAMEKARELGLTVCAFLGKDAGPMDGIADWSIHIPSDETARVQECHITIGHIVCDLVEAHFAGCTKNRCT